jgi:hypothetical protein
MGWLARGVFSLNELAGRALNFPAIFVDGAMRRIKRFVDGHRDLAAFLGLVALCP